jgi:hypothetical protein
VLLVIPERQTRSDQKTLQTASGGGMRLGKDKNITSGVIVAYSQCPRKAFLLLCTDENGITPDYVRILEHRRMTNRNKHVHMLKQNNHRVTSYDAHSRESRDAVFTDSHLIYEDLEAYCDILTRAEGNHPGGAPTYEPTMVVGTYSISKEQRLELSFVGYVLGKLQDRLPSIGKGLQKTKHSHVVIHF